MTVEEFMNELNQLLFFNDTTEEEVHICYQDGKMFFELVSYVTFIDGACGEKDLLFTPDLDELMTYLRKRRGIES